jgi:tetratricopeptide (TPR) repeat protein
MMKKTTLFLLVAMMSTGIVFSQKVKKPNINKALKMMQAGELADAQSEIDRASTDEKLQSNGKTWYYRGLIYASIDTSSTASADNALQIAMESFAKADELGKEGTEYYISDANGLPLLKSQQIQTLWGVYLNQGVTAFQNKVNKDAVAAFEKSSMVNPQDTTGYLYAGLASQNDKSYENALKNYEKYLEVGGLSADVYASMIYIVGTEQKDNDGALALIQKAKTAFPQNTLFPKQEIDILIKLDKVDEAVAGLEKAIAAEPENAQLRFSLGVMYDNLKNKEKAIEAYEGSITADPDFYNAHFNLAVLRYNDVIEMVKERNDLGITAADLKKSVQMDKDIDVELKKVLPNWEKVHEMDAKDTTPMETLKYIYVQLKMMDKAEAMQTKLDNSNPGE